MTREEAIEILKDLWRTKHSMYLEVDIRKALEMAIKALEQEPKTGYWILDDSDDGVTCDKCECTVYVLDMVDGEIHYCPNCGDKKEGITWID